MARKKEKKKRLSRLKPVLFQTYKGRLIDFFPVSHPDAAWMWRLAIIHDDARYERMRLAWQDKADPVEEVWRMAYYSRRVASTIHEGKRILGHEGGKWLKKHWKRISHQDSKMIADFIRHIEEFAISDVDRVRNKVGIHIEAFGLSC